LRAAKAWSNISGWHRAVLYSTQSPEFTSAAAWTAEMLRADRMV
jgi:hypothetical protein